MSWRKVKAGVKNNWAGLVLCHLIATLAEEGNEMGDVAPRLESEFKSEDPGFNPLAGLGEEQFSVPPSQLLCRLVCA